MKSKEIRCKFRIPEGGKRALWEITNRCNLNCSYCIFSANASSSELTTKECFKVIDELYRNGFTHLKITGGEPFIRKDILEILAYACKFMKVDISTNGTLLNEEMIRKLGTLNLEMIHVSVDGLEAQHAQLRGKGSYRHLMFNLERLVAQSHLYVRVGTVLYKGNEHSLAEIVNKLFMKGVDEVIFSIMEPVGRLNGDKSLVITRNIGDIAHEIKCLRAYYPNFKISYNWDTDKEGASVECVAGERFVYINNQGQVSPCTWIIKHNKPLLSNGTLIDHSLPDLLRTLPCKAGCILDVTR